ERPGAGRRDLAESHRQPRRHAQLRRQAAERAGRQRVDHPDQQRTAGTQRHGRTGRHGAWVLPDLRRRPQDAHTEIETRHLHLLLLRAGAPPGGDGRDAERPMRLYVCWGTFPTPRLGGHPCANAHHALKDAGYDPEVVKSYGLAPLPGVFNQTRGRREVQELTGNRWVPTLVLDDGTVIDDSRAIADWARANP